MKKICDCCGENLDIELFYLNKNCKEGRERKCKNCRNSASAKNYEKNRERLKSVRHEWYEKNKNWYLPHTAEYAKSHVVERRETINKWAKIQRATNLNYKLKNNYRSRIVNAIRKSSKSARTQELIGCTISFLKSYLESQFDSKMSWENYGSYWHIDHIIPCDFFDFSIPEHQFKCFNYTNTRPLEAKENIRKQHFINEDLIREKGLYDVYQSILPKTTMENICQLNYSSTISILPS